MTRERAGYNARCEEFVTPNEIIRGSEGVAPSRRKHRGSGA